MRSKYTDTILLTAFDKRYHEGKSLAAIACELGVDKRYLSAVMLGKRRKTLKERWEVAQSRPSLSAAIPTPKCSSLFKFFKALGLPLGKA